MVDLAEEATLSLEQDAVPWPSRVYDGRVEVFCLRRAALRAWPYTPDRMPPCRVAQNAN